MPDTAYPGPETIHRSVLDNGITLLVYENFAAETVVIDGLVRAGALVETRQHAGLANFTAEMLLRGTARRTFEQIYEELESVGASLDISGGRHTTEFSGSSLAEDLGLVLELLADSLRHPAFPERQLEALRGEILTSLQIQANDTHAMAAHAFRELLYQDHPYGLNVDGYLDSIPTITRDDLVAFHDRYYGSRGMIMTVVGAVRHEEVLAKVKAALGDWQPAQQPMPDLPPVTRPATTVRRHVNMPHKTQSDILLGLPGPVRAAPDYLAASMANTILGVFGMMGRLGQNVREVQGLAYYAYSRLQGGLGPSPWYVSTGVSPDKVEQAISSILHEIDRLCHEPIPEEELADSQAYRTGSLPVSLETNDGLAGIISDMELYTLGLDYLQLLPDRLNALTPETVQAAAQKYLSAEELAIAVAGPELPAT
ncbi:MAG: insulinase family protein [Chloroflexi bacterium]|nr:insulinase family protein [Chloroflexota bacterium]MCI0576573.1 insulinase family protein [Chloroflexota bacterium]MCI0643796.1 insulinase family protein [Chloroflexota bacterium]MCI0726909.1 insulinase family protein [Chloroflexota bacterium]